MNTQTAKKGFTIIEVVLVLAIAGLIFLMVFIALPALQGSQRDTARKNDVSTVAAAVNSYTGNNRGTFPTTATLESYVTSVSANTTEVIVGTAGATSIAPDDGVITVTQRSRCGDSTTTNQTLTSGTTRQYTVVTKLEAGNGAYYCQDA
jgi:prepilin-type N-terminal cleavage/methylation domain-containing protein